MRSDVRNSDAAGVRSNAARGARAGQPAGDLPGAQAVHRHRQDEHTRQAQAAAGGPSHAAGLCGVVRARAVERPSPSCPPGAGAPRTAATSTVGAGEDSVVASSRLREAALSEGHQCTLIGDDTLAAAEQGIVKLAEFGV